ncbi:MAG: hypothetical protein HC780_14695 [Leptolyngbyaceae cyanobacterium CSU_1_3]|nr:hypothetical protein [Leptolyngbyaceae cyanobacterium CSU_1_3]
MSNQVFEPNPFVLYSHDAQIQCSIGTPVAISELNYKTTVTRLQLQDYSYKTTFFDRIN